MFLLGVLKGVCAGVASPLLLVLMLVPAVAGPSVPAVAGPSVPLLLLLKLMPNPDELAFVTVPVPIPVPLDPELCLDMMCVTCWAALAGDANHDAMPEPMTARFLTGAPNCN